jgi:leucyl/phenylalanyl-tRNA--protein transferase
LHRESIDGVAAHSVELYDGDELVAGEIGYTCGAAYTSMSGFHLRSGSGSVQLAALGVLLQRAGFAFWDLGMPMEYKQALGARVVPRETFFDLYLDARRGETPAVAPRSACASLLADGSTASR